MVAVFTGNGLGLYNTSYTQLGAAFGSNVGLGQSRESQYVNLASGNLVLRDLDENLLVRGMSAAFLRTYNSRGQVSGTGQDGWITGFERSVSMSGTLNVAGSIVTLNTGDGQSVVFTYSGTANLYTTTAGDGAHDTMTWNAATAQWLFVDGSTRREELYDDALKGRLSRIRELKSDGSTPAQFDIVYDLNNRVTEVRSVDDAVATGSRDALVFTYNAAGQLASISTRESGVLRSQVSYGYENADGSGRLLWVQTDLTPDVASDNTWDATVAANNDGKRFRTSYTYVSATASDLRIASVSTSDGITVAYTYEADGSGGFRVKTVAQGSAADGSTQTTTFTYGAGSTDVTDGAGRTWTYQYDAAGQLIAVLEPAVDGLRQKTSYTYDSAGNVTRISQAPSAGAAAALDTVFRYDGNGNRVLQRDQSGNAIEWTYNASNQVTAEIRYSIADADGLDPSNTGTFNQPSGALTTRYIYDGSNRIRFVLDATGMVRELTYATSGNGIGQIATERQYLGAVYTDTVYTEAALNAWASDGVAQRRANSTLTVYSYDAKGRMSQSEAYATVTADANGSGVFDAATDLVRYTYDAQGLLRQRVAVRGATRALAAAAPASSEIVDYVYDGMGRLLTQLSRAAAIAAMPDARTDAAGYATWLAANDGATLLTVYAYTDSGSQIRITSDAGATRTTSFNRAGAIATVSDSGTVSGSTVTRTTQNWYDASGRLRASQDASGGRSYYFYDGAGRLSAVVDPTGSVVRTVYDGIGRVTQQIACARIVSTAGWLSGSTVLKDTLVYAATAPALAANQAWVQTDAANDRTASRSYDASGRIATQTDAAGLTTTYVYDAAGRLLSTTTSKPGDATAVPRVARYFYDAANRVVATLDAEGYLAESIYDAGGRLVRQIRYANVTSAALRASGTLAQLRPATQTNDQSARIFYNARNQVVGTLDAEGYFTENLYDEAANQRAVKAYAKQLVGLSGNETFATLKTLATTGAPAEAFRLTQRSYNALGQVATEQDDQGTVTNYIYDEAGRLVKTQAAAGTSEVREGNLRYDVFGNLIGELGGEGSTRLLPGMTEAQIDAIYAQYGVRHNYDLVGRRTESIDAAGNRTWYFYDAAGRQTFVVRGVADSANVQNALGEVSETRYDAFGGVTDAIAYTGRIVLATPGSRASAQSAIATLTFNASLDSRTQIRYDQRGQVTERIDAEGIRTLYGYTAFGELRTQQDLELDNSVRRTLTSTYDNRGLMTAQSEAGGALSRSIGIVYDAFGRAVTRIDARGTSSTSTYDRLGRQLTQTLNGVSGRNETTSMTYDAFGRVLTRVDALGRTTAFAYSDSARSLTVTTPEGVSVTTTHNRFGQDVTVSQTLPDGSVATTTTSYNKDGQVVGVLDPLNRSATRSYDARGLLIATVDASNRRVEYTYDAAGRVLTRREDPTGLNLVSTYAYDGQGRQMSVTDASGVKTTLNYDRKGQLIETLLDPNGLALRTTYVRDRDGREVTVTTGAGTAAAAVVSYAYDAFGRRTSETVSPGVLNLVTTYTYDVNNNVVRKTDATNRTTRYSYDAANRMRYSVDDAGSVTEVVYDANGNATATRRYAKAATIAALAAAPSEADMAALVAAQLLENDARDDVVYRIYDRDGRLVMSIDGTGATIELHYDSAGRKTTERRYSQPATLTASLRAQLKAGTATADGVRAVIAINAAKDMLVRYVYDAAGEIAFTIDAVGAVTRTWFDAAGRTVAVRRYAAAINPAAATDATTVAALQALVVESSADLGEYRLYDGAGRVACIIDLAGTVRQVGYDNAGRTVLSRVYSVPITLTLAQRDALRAGTATVADYANFFLVNEATSRVQSTVFDSAGRARYTVSRSENGLAEIAETQYDAAGRVVAQLRYGVSVSFATTYTETTLGAALNAALSSNATIRATQIRTQRYVYDAAGRQHYIIDASGSLAEWRYDGAGRVTDTIAYGQRPPSTTTSESALNTWVAAQVPADIRRTRSTFDAAGRLQSNIDANNATESYTYDAADRMLTRTDRANNVWTYEYDAAGRRTAEISPLVQVTSLSSNGTVGVETRSIATRFTYDALGNVTARIDNADAPITTDRRTTRYVYDNRGFQVSTIFPDAGAWNVVTGALEATGVQATIEITYNALGQAVVQKDVRNNYSYKVYDAAGRIASEIDAEGCITGYDYNAFGEVRTLRRYETKLNTAPLAGWTAGQPLTAAQLQIAGVVTTGANDRTIATTYTALGRKATVVQSATAYYRANGSAATGSPTRAFAYNAYGDLVQESDLLEGTAGNVDAVWATATRYYDALGRNTLTVDALGYVTTTAYNATGEAIETVEYARALAGTQDPNTRPGLPAPGDGSIGNDRITRWTYDALGRKSTETSVRQYRRTDGSTGTRNVVSTYGYDNEGRVTSVADDTGTTVTTYDAVGRTLSVQEPARNVIVQSADAVLGNSAAQDLAGTALYETRSPYTTMAYDAFGNAVIVRRYANGKNGTAAAVADDARDQVQTMRYDWQGRAVWERNAEGAVVTRRYDAADNVLEVDYALQGNGGRSYAVRVVNTYDKVGRQTGTRTERDTLLAGAYQNTAIDAGETVTYNAFGEITTKVVQGLSGTLTYGYDVAGRMVSTNETGATRSLGYDLAGHLVRSAQTVYLGAVEGTTLAVTTIRVDKLGRTLSTTMPSYTTTLSTTASITQTVDRWGNVLRIVDARGYQTDYEYNSLNQLTREIRPLVKVVSETGAVTWQRPVVERYYDALGRMVATRDANGNLKSSEYDATGRMVAARDANGNVTRYAYDALGNQRLTQNPLGYLSFKEYDRNGRVVAIGDYLPSPTGTTRNKSVQQSYTLNANGDRVIVTDALNAQSLYDYDSRNQLLRSQTAEGVVMQYAYDAGGHKIRESNALSAGSTTLIDRDGESVRINEQSWDYDVFGRLIDHNNLSGRDSNYVYDAASGLLIQETANGGQGILTGDGNRTTSYYANGKVRLIVEGATSYRYEYDAAGNRTLEEVTTADIYGAPVHTITRTTYDSNNRVERVTQDDLVAVKRIFDLLTEYDANGNRRHVRALSGYGPNVDGIVVTNNAPVVIRAVDNRTVRKGVNAQFRLLFTDIFRDAEQDALSLTIAQADGSALPAWLTVSRDPITGELVFNAAPGAALADQDIVVKLTASESANPANTVSTTFTVSVRANSAPTLVEAGDIGLRIKTGQVWTRDLVASDYFRDVDVGDVLALSIENAATLPAWLTVDASNPGAIRLSGTPNVSGSFTIRLRATDQSGAYVVKQFNITTAPNSAPQVVAVPQPVDAILNRQFDWTRSLASVFSDLEGDRMQVTARLSDGSALPAWMSFQYLYDQATPQLKFTGNVPASEVDGRVYNIVMTATDADGAASTTTLSVRVFANRAPAPTAGVLTLPPLRVNDTYSQTFALSSLFVDPENDALDLNAIWPAGSTLPQWLRMTVDYSAQTVTFSGHPTSNAQAGTLAFDVRATDIAGLVGTKSFSLTIGTDTAPVRSTVAVPDTTVSIGRSFSYTLPAGMFTDPDGDAFTLSAQVATQNSETTYEDTIPPRTITTYWVDYSALPTWMTFNPATRTISGTVPANQPAGSIIVRIMATDSRGRVSTADEQFVGSGGATGDGDIVFNVQPWTNTPPVYNVGTLPNRTLVHGGAVSFALPAGAFTEPDGDALSYSAQVLIGSTWTNISALGLSINASTGLISGTALNLTQTSYSARIVASDPQGATGTGTFTFAVTNTAPTAGTIPSQTAGRNQAFALNVAAYFSDVNADALSFTATGLPAGLTISAAGAISGASTAALGVYSVTVTASDGRGGTVSSSFTITVANSAPVAPAVPNQTATGGTAWSYTPAAFTDPNGDALTYSASGLPAWMSFNAATRTFSGTPGVTGNWTIVYTATDPSGAAASTSFVVTTPSAPPVYNGTLTTQVAAPGVAFTYTVPAGAFTDPNGDALTYSADGNGVALPSWLSFNAATRTFTGTPSAAGSWTIRVMASDGTSTVSGTFGITTANVAPVYNNTLPARSGQSGAAVSWTLPAGAFTDANGDALNYTLEVERPGYWELYYLAPGEPDYRWVAPTWVLPSSVGLSIAANGTVSGTLQPLYAPKDYGGSMYYYSYNMRITARDPSTLSAAGTFAVSVNAAPVAPAISAPGARQNSAYSYTLPAFTDLNGDALTYSVSNLPPGIGFDPATRILSGTPTTAGSWTVTYTANDGRGSATSTTFTLSVAANNAPVAPSVAAQTGSLNTALSIALPAFTDADFDTLTYSASNLPTGLSFNPSTQMITGTPTATGTWTVTYTANDGRGGITSTSFTITISNVVQPNRAPVVTVLLVDQSADTGIPFEYIFAANSFTDPDGNPLTYTATQASGTALPTWLKFDAVNRRFWGTPTGTTNQTLTIRVVARDPSGLSVYDDFVLTKFGSGGGGGGQIPLRLASVGGSTAQPLAATAVQADPNAASDVYVAPDPAIGPVGHALASIAADKGLAIAAQAAAAAAGRVYTFDMGASLAPSARTDVASTPQTLAVSDTSSTDLASTQPVVNALATSVPVQVKDEWYVYDAENRLKLVGGQLVGVAGAAGTYIGLAGNVNSYELMYDAAGQVIGRGVQSGANHILYRTTYDLRGRKQYEFHAEYLNPVTFAYGGLSKQYIYDTADRLIETRSFYRNGTSVAAPKDGEGFPLGPPMSIAGWLSNAETMSYDRDGRMTLQISYARASTSSSTWMEPGTFDDTAQRTSLSTLAENSRVMYSDAVGNSGYDALGRVTTYRYTAKDISWATHTYTSTYEGWEGYVEKYVQGVSSNTNYRATTNTLTYDAFGRLIRQIENTPLPSNYGALYDRARAYTYNGDGRVQTRREGTIENGVFTQTADSTGARANFQFVHAAGQQQAELKEGGQIRYSSGYTYDTPQIQTLNGSGNYAAGGGTVTVLQGENLQSLAQRVYGNSSQWYVLADANGLSDPDAPLIAGTQLNTPKVTVSSNDAGTFQPYNPADATGPTAPGLPYITPPPKKSCNPLAMVLMIVIAVVVTVFTAGAAAVAMSAAAQGVGFGTALAGMGGSIMAVGGSVLTGGAIAAGAGMAVALGGSITAATMAAAAVGGFMGSVASQMVGKALGVVDHFSLRSAVASGLSAGLTAGVGASGVVGKLAGSGEYAHIARGAIGSAIGGVTSYAANRAAGIDVSFNWRSIAAGAVGAAVTATIMPTINSAFGFDMTTESGQFGADVVGNFVGGVVNTHVRRAFGFDDSVNYGALLVDAFGNALANAVVGRHKQQAEAARLDQERVKAMQAQLDEASKRLGMNRERMQQFLADLDAKRATLSGDDKDNPLFLALGGDIPDDVKRQLWASYQAGDIRFNTRVGDLSDAYADYVPGENGGVGTITLNSRLVDMMRGGGPMSALAGAVLQQAYWEEQGHQLDDMARAIAGIGGDSPNDEGALFAVLMTQRAIADSSPGAMSSAIPLVDGTSLQVNTTTTFMKVAANYTLATGRIMTDTHDPVSGRETYGPEGHYFTTGLVALGVVTALGIPGGRQIAAKLALWSQIPDMVEAFDAKSQWLSRWSFGFSQSDLKDMSYTFTAIHNLAPAGQGTVEWSKLSREKTRDLIIKAISDGDYDVAGIGIHKLGDSYAHTHGGIPYVMPNGHMWDSIFGSDPDVLTSRAALARQYVGDLATTLAKGFGASGDNLTRAVNAGVGLWTTQYNSALKKGWHWEMHGKAGMAYEWSAELAERAFRDSSRAYLSGQWGSNYTLTDKQLDTYPGLRPGLPSDLLTGHDAYWSHDRFLDAMGITPHWTNRSGQWYTKPGAAQPYWSDPRQRLPMGQPMFYWPPPPGYRPPY